MVVELGVEGVDLCFYIGVVVGDFFDEVVCFDDVDVLFGWYVGCGW